MLLIKFLGLFFKMGKMEHEAFHCVSLVADLNGDGVMRHRFLPTAHASVADIMGAASDFGKVNRGNCPPACCDYPEFIILFGVFQSQRTASDKHHVALPVDHFKFNLCTLSDGLQNDSEIPYVLLVFKGISIIILIVNIVIRRCELGLHIFKVREFYAK